MFRGGEQELVSPRLDMWTVVGDKPKNQQHFDNNVAQTLQSFSRHLGYNNGESSPRVYEGFPKESEAQDFAEHIKDNGATSVRIIPPR